MLLVSPFLLTRTLDVIKLFKGIDPWFASNLTSFTLHIFLARVATYAYVNVLNFAGLLAHIHRDHSRCIDKLHPCCHLSRPDCNPFTSQTIIAAQINRYNRGRDERPLRVMNTDWMCGVDWELLEAKAMGYPLPTGADIEWVLILGRLCAMSEH